LSTVVCEQDKIAHQALYKEIHLVDNLLETHANIMIVLISGMLFFIFRGEYIQSKMVMSILSALGLAVSLEFCLHTYRFKHIGICAEIRLKRIEERMGIDTERKPTILVVSGYKIEIPRGSTLLLGISIVFTLIWLAILILLAMGRI